MANVTINRNFNAQVRLRRVRAFVRGGGDSRGFLQHCVGSGNGASAERIVSNRKRVTVRRLQKEQQQTLVVKCRGHWPVHLYARMGICPYINKLGWCKTRSVVAAHGPTTRLDAWCRQPHGHLRLFSLSLSLWNCCTNTYMQFFSIQDEELRWSVQWLCSWMWRPHSTSVFFFTILRYIDQIYTGVRIYFGDFVSHN